MFLLSHSTYRGRLKEDTPEKAFWAGVEHGIEITMTERKGTCVSTQDDFCGDPAPWHCSLPVNHPGPHLAGTGKFGPGYVWD